MLKFICIFVFGIIINVLLSETKDITHSEYLLEHPSHQSCDNVRLNETQEKLEKLSVQQTAIKDQIEGHQASLKESWIKIISESIEDRLDRIESKQVTVETQLTDIQKTLLDIKMSLEKVKRLLPKFERIGNKYFYIEHNETLNWSSAARECELMGGYLAYNFSENEFNELKSRLNPSVSYFLGINDIQEEGVFRTGSSGKRATFLKWGFAEPASYTEDQHCVVVYHDLMWVLECRVTFRFVCQADKSV